MSTLPAKPRTADEYFAVYGSHHKHPTNKAIHWICVPTIVLTVLGLLWEVQPLPDMPWANLAVVFMLGAMLFYLRLSPALAAGMLVYAVGSLSLLYFLDRAGYPVWLLSLIVFVVAWIGQFIGHKIEGAKPSFFDDVKYLMIGPIWLLAFLYRKWGIKYS